MPTFSQSLEQSLHRALAIANERHHQYATLEHLLLSLLRDEDNIAAQILNQFSVTYDAVRAELDNIISGRPTSPPKQTAQEKKPERTKTPVLEPKDVLKRRIDEAAKVLPLDQLCLSPQCGFASNFMGNPVTVDDEKRKLALVVETAQEVWGQS